MKLLLTALASFILAVSFLAAPSHLSEKEKKLSVSRVKRFAIRCSPLLADFDFTDTSSTIPLLQGWGNYRMPVTTGNDSALIYFEQGINMYYGFHVIEALASFERSVQLDNNFAMGYWGMALSYGPNINDFGYSTSPAALTAMRKAKELSANGQPLEQALIGAMQVRYSPDSSQTREYLNQLYGDAMKKVFTKFSANADAGALYADALMVQHPWDLYSKKYVPRSWTPEIVHTLEKVLARHPEHPGAAHYYIHAVEASAHPEAALNVSRKLGLRMPGVAHVVHMPSHIFIRSGYYSEGEISNEKAVKGYYDYLGRFPAIVNNSPLYLIHNLHMQAACANMTGNYKSSMKASIDCRNSFDTSLQSTPDYPGVFIQYVYMTPVLTQIRFGEWDEILQLKPVSTVYIYANYLLHYARGMAYARKKNFIGASAELDSLKKLIAEPQLKAPAPSYANPGIAGAKIAEKILEGIMAEEQKQLPAALNLLKAAVVLEDSMIYNEPKDWVHPTRQYYGNVLLKAGKYQQAKSVFKEDLFINPNNGWSLTGLAQAQYALGKKAMATATAAKAKKAFAGSDLTIKHAVF
jgi:tetratricopeptide (TPR) repeat protein